MDVQYQGSTRYTKVACLSTYYLEYGRHVGQLRRRRSRRAYAPTSNIASHDNHEEINSRVSFSFLYEYGAALGGPSGRWSSAINGVLIKKETNKCSWKHLVVKAL